MSELFIGKDDEELVGVGDRVRIEPYEARVLSIKDNGWMQVGMIDTDSHGDYVAGPGYLPPRLITKVEPPFVPEIGMELTAKNWHDFPVGSVALLDYEQYSWFYYGTPNVGYWHNGIRTMQPEDLTLMGTPIIVRVGRTLSVDKERSDLVHGEDAP